MAISIKCMLFVFMLVPLPVNGFWFDWWNWRLRRDLHLTYNTALLDFSLAPGIVSNNREQRRDEMINILSRSNADLVCLQEVWIGQDVEKFVEDLKGDFPYSYSGLHYDNGTLPPQANGIQDPACNIALLTAFRDCANASGCLDNPNGQGLCAVNNCPNEFGALLVTSEECVTCAFVMLSRSVDDIFSVCTAAAPAVGLRNMNKLGLLMLSKKPLANMSFTEFHQFPALIERGYLEATYDDYLKAVCTHLTSPDNRGFQEPLLPFANSSLQAQFEASFLIDQFKDEDPVVIMGDMNTGLQFRPNFTPIEPALYNLLVSQFHKTKPSRKCTFCPAAENVYNTGQGDERSVIDHIMGTGIHFFQGWRVLTFPRNCVTDNGVNVPLSDHFGYQSKSWHFQYAPHTYGKRDSLDTLKKALEEMEKDINNVSDVNNNVENVNNNVDNVNNNVKKQNNNAKKMNNNVLKKMIDNARKKQ